MTERRTVRVNHQARAATAERRRARTRERLLAAAEKVIADRGVHAVSIEHFVAAAGVSRGTFYNYFPTTEALLHAMNQRVARDLDSQLDLTGRDIVDPVVRFAAALHTLLHAYRDDPVRAWVAMHVAASSVERSSVFELRFSAIYDEAVGLGRFRPVELGAARALVFGSMRMAHRDLVAGEASPNQTTQVVALILAALGTPYDEAEQISAAEAASPRTAGRPTTH